MKIMKFGGTSVGDASVIKKVISIIKSNLPQQMIVVVSAISQATNILHKSGILAAQGTNASFDEAMHIINDLKKRHITIAKNLITDSIFLKDAENKIDSYFSDLEKILRGIFLLSDLSGRSYAKVVAFGELLSSAIIHSAMQGNGIDNILVDARQFMFTDDNYFHGKADIDSIKQKMPEALNSFLAGGHNILTQGFIASTINGATTTFGREGSDYSAALIAMAMKADEIEIWTDVDGIMSADPRRINNTKLISTISFSEASELANFGAKVIHPSTIAPAVEQNIPVRILNTMSMGQKGTVILSDSKENREGVKSIAGKEEVKLLSVSSKENCQGYKFFKKLFEALDSNHIVGDVFSIALNRASLVLDCPAENIEKVVADLSHFAELDFDDNKSMITLVGKGLKNINSAIEKSFHALSKFVIPMIVCGASDHSLCIVTKREDFESAMQVLHDEFFTGDNK